MTTGTQTTTKMVHLAHVLVAASWLGAVLSMLALLSANDPRTDVAACAVSDVVVWSSLAVLCTSLCFGLFTPWGFFKLRFVRVKWTALSALALLGVFFRTPALNSLAAVADTDGLAGPRLPALILLVVEAAVLIAVFAVSVVRPWGAAVKNLEPGPRLRVVIVVVVVVTLGFSIAQSAYLASLRRTPIAAVSLHDVKDGDYEGEASVGVVARVRATVRGGRLEDVVVLALPDGRYPTLARGVTRKMVRSQRVDVDGVSGATTTSRAIQLATVHALQPRP